MATNEDPQPEPDRRHLLVPASAMLAWVLVAALGGVPAEVAKAFPVAPASLRWVLAPGFAAAGAWALLAPGVLLAACRLSGATFSTVVVLGFAASQALLIAATSAAKLAGLVPLERPAFLGILLVLILGSSAAYLLGLRRRSARPFARDDALPALVLAITTVGLVACLLPEMFWQDLNPDGFEAMEIGRALRWVVVPRFPTQSGFLGLGIGMVTMAWSNHWWVLLAGPIEAAVRLPMAWHAVPMVAGIVALAEFRSARALRPAEWGLVAMAASAVLVVLAFNASYDPYHADISSPAAYEALTVALLCGMVVAAWSGRWSWLAGVALLGCLARPTALLVGGLLAVAMVVADRARFKEAVRVGGITVAAFAVAYLLYEVLAVRSLAESVANEYRTGSLVSRFQYVTFSDPIRLLWVALPAGLVPWIALAAWRRQDVLARQLTLVTLAYAALFLPLAFTNLHQFVPAMVFPVAVYWRLASASPSPTPWRWAAAVGAAASIGIAAPRHRAVDRAGRALGEEIDFRIGRFDRGYGEYREAIRARASLGAILSPWAVPDARRERIGGFHLLHYAMQPRSAGVAPNFVVQKAAAAPPPGMTLVESKPGWSVWVADSARWAARRFGSFNLDWKAAPYNIPLESMLPHLGIPRHAYDVDLRAVGGRILRALR